MKKKMYQMLMAGLAVCLFCSTALAAGTVTETMTEAGDNYVWTLSFVADSADGSIPAATMSSSVLKRVKGSYLYLIATNPGATAPTDNWDIVIANADGAPDVLGSQCLDRDATASEVCYASAYYMVDAAMVMSITGNSVNSAAGTVKVFFVK